MPPLIELDLDADVARQVVVDREPGQYLGHPTTTLLRDGKTILAVYPKGHGSGPIVMKRSPDGGLTWSDRLPVPENWVTSLEVPTIYHLEGRRLVLFSGRYPARMARSEDEGETWTPLEPIGDFGGLVIMSDLLRLKDGAWFGVFHDAGRWIGNKEGGPKRFVIYQSTSRDGGLTWSDAAEVMTHPEADWCEPALLRSPDGSSLAMILREQSRKFNSFITFSRDEAKTWSVPVELPSSLTGDRHQARLAPDGRILISFRDRQNPPRAGKTWGDWVAWVGTWEDLENQRPGQYHVRLKDNKPAFTQEGSGRWHWDSGYAGVEVLPDHTFVLTSYGYWKPEEESYVLSIRLKLAELDALAQALTR